MAKVGLTREAVVARAVEIADADGLKALSMRRLASELGVEAMSLYHHVANKDDLHRGLVDYVWGLVDLSPDPDWRARMHRMCRSAHDAMLAHPWFFEFPVTYGGMHRIAMINAMQEAMSDGGIDPAAAYHGQHVLDGHVFGYSWQDVDYSNGTALEDRADEMLAAIDPARFPHLMAHARQHMEGAPEGSAFEMGIDICMDWMERASHR